MQFQALPSSNTCFFTKPFKTNAISWFLIPRSTPKRPKTGPRRIQEGLQSLLVSCWNLYSVFDCFGLNCGPFWEAFWASTSVPNRTPFLLLKLHRGNKRPRDRPKITPRWPKTTLFLPKSVFSDVMQKQMGKTTFFAPPTGPISPQDGPKTT